MRDEDDPFLMREFDFSRAVLGRFAYAFTPEQREDFLRKAPLDFERNWHAVAEEALDRVAARLFAYLVLVEGEPVRAASARSAALGPPPAAAPGIVRRLGVVRAEREWLASPLPEDRRERLGWVERAGRLLSAADALSAELREEVRRHLTGGGLPPGEIERRTEEAARLWRAA
jgi:hypothetical protein